MVSTKTGLESGDPPSEGSVHAAKSDDLAESQLSDSPRSLEQESNIDADQSILRRSRRTTARKQVDKEAAAPTDMLLHASPAETAKIRAGQKNKRLVQPRENPGTNTRETGALRRARSPSLSSPPASKKPRTKAELRKQVQKQAAEIVAQVASSERESIAQSEDVPGIAVSAQSVPSSGDHSPVADGAPSSSDNVESSGTNPTAASNAEAASTAKDHLIEEMFQRLRRCISFFAPPNYEKSRAEIMAMTKEQILDINMSSYFNAYKVGLTKLIADHRQKLVNEVHRSN